MKYLNLSTKLIGTGVVGSFTGCGCSTRSVGLTGSTLSGSAGVSCFTGFSSDLFVSSGFFGFSSLPSPSSESSST